MNYQKTKDLDQKEKKVRIVTNKDIEEKNNEKKSKKKKKKRDSVKTGDSDSLSKKENPEEKKEQQDFLAENFIILMEIGKGAFGQLFLSYNTRDSDEVACKKEFKKIEKSVSQLKTEFAVYKTLLHIAQPNINQNQTEFQFDFSGKSQIPQEEIQGIPKFYGFGETSEFYYLIIQLLGPNLIELFNFCGKRKFTVSTVAMIAIQMLNRIEYMHKHHYLHRDIKPENFLIGCKDKSNIIYLIDYGLCKKYKDNKTHQHIPYREGRMLTGTARYVSINTHLGIEQSRRDDLESIGYVLVFFLKGSLPWQGLKSHIDKYNKIMEKKLQIPTEILCFGLPEEIIHYLNYCKSLRFEDRPDYDYLRGLFVKLLYSCINQYSLTKDYLIFDWCFEDTNLIWSIFNRKKLIKKNEAESSSSNNLITPMGFTPLVFKNSSKFSPMRKFSNKGENFNFGSQIGNNATLSALNSPGKIRMAEIEEIKETPKNEFKLPTYTALNNNNNNNNTDKRDSKIQSEKIDDSSDEDFSPKHKQSVKSEATIKQEKSLSEINRIINKTNNINDLFPSANGDEIDTYIQKLSYKKDVQSENTNKITALPNNLKKRVSFDFRGNLNKHEDNDSTIEMNVHKVYENVNLLQLSESIDSGLEFNQFSFLNKNKFKNNNHNNASKSPKSKDNSISNLPIKDNKINKSININDRRGSAINFRNNIDDLIQNQYISKNKEKLDTNPKYSINSQNEINDNTDKKDPIPKFNIQINKMESSENKPKTDSNQFNNDMLKLSNKEKSNTSLNQSLGNQIANISMTSNANSPKSKKNQIDTPKNDEPLISLKNALGTSVNLTSVTKKVSALDLSININNVLDTDIGIEKNNRLKINKNLIQPGGHLLPQKSFESEIILKMTDEIKERRKSKIFEVNNNPLFKFSKDQIIKISTETLLKYYTIHSELGQGSYGTVKKVKHKQLGEERAMKIVKKKLESSQNEIDILKKISHPNIISIYEIFEDSKNYFIITEYLEGGELFESISNQGSFNEYDAAKIIKQILSAVNYLHGRMIMHRDLKPENILLINKKNSHEIKLIDFGAAKQYERNQKLTKFIGTSYYIAPEVLAESYDERCDVWSCGVILYILLCGYPPFNGSTSTSIYNAIKNTQPSFKGEDWRDISKDAIDLIKQMLTKNYLQRPSIEMCLNHKFLKNLDADEGKSKLSPLKAIKRMQDFVFQNNFKKAVLQYISSQFNLKSEEESLRILFKQFDVNKNGVINKKEFTAAISKYFGENETKLDNIFDNIDTDGSGEISYNEFLTSIIDSKALITNDRLEKAFKMFDKDNNGKISCYEIKAIFGGDENKWKKILSEVDINGDGEIDFKEFKLMMSGVDESLIV